MSDQIQKMISDVLREAEGGLDPKLTREALVNMQKAVARQMEALSTSKYKRRKVEARCPSCQVKSVFTMPAPDPEAIARAAVATAKAGDTVARLGEFLAGKPDSRPGEQGLDWLRALTPEQFNIVQGWIEAAR